jgi:hypothetical protein
MTVLDEINDAIKGAASPTSPSCWWQSLKEALWWWSEVSLQAGRVVVGMSVVSVVVGIRVVSVDVVSFVRTVRFLL